MTITITTKEPTFQNLKRSSSSSQALVTGGPQLALILFTSLFLLPINLSSSNNYSHFSAKFPDNFRSSSVNYYLPPLSAFSDVFRQTQGVIRKCCIGRQILFFSILQNFLIIFNPFIYHRILPDKGL